ncbi:MAG: hypothetical protein JEY79_19330 [Pseudodesulfovibrio sp.]|nr:hypothetical protein [Pseudodesulfovibrio sp.]
MKKIVSIGLMLVIVLVFYNSNWFQSTFVYGQFYENIYSAPFDVTQKGNRVVIPIKYKYATSYGLAVSVPDGEAFTFADFEEGSLRYRFISKDQILGEGMTLPLIGKNRIVKDGSSSIDILIFTLPISGAGDDLTLDLEVITPIKFLNGYSGKITCFINPYYESK